MDVIELHKKLKGKITIKDKTPIKSADDLTTLYTPGVADPCKAIAKDKSLVYDLTMKGNTVAIVTDGTRVLGLGDIGPEASLPVMEGKALIMQQFAGIDAFPICINEKDPDKFVEIVKAISPVFGAINLEDVETPKVFSIEKRLTQELDIPVFHDDQHGTAIVVLSALYNALKITGKGNDVKIVLVGAGSAGYGIVRLLLAAGFKNIIAFDSKGAIYKSRESLTGQKKSIAELSNSEDYKGKLEDLKDVDVIVSAAAPGSLPLETVKNMKKPKIVFALANPIPEISLEQAKELKIDVFGTGRSDYPNQINNSVCFPGFLRALLDYRVTKITDEMKIAAAKGIADTVSEDELKQGRIMPDTFNKHVSNNIKQKIGNLVK